MALSIKMLTQLTETPPHSIWTGMKQIVMHSTAMMPHGPWPLHSTGRSLVRLCVCMSLSVCLSVCLYRTNVTVLNQSLYSAPMCIDTMILAFLIIGGLWLLLGQGSACRSQHTGHAIETLDLGLWQQVAKAAMLQQYLDILWVVNCLVLLF